MKGTVYKIKKDSFEIISFKETVETDMGKVKAE